MQTRTDTGYAIRDVDTGYYLLLIRRPNSCSLDWVEDMMDATVFDSFNELDMWIQMDLNLVVVLMEVTRTVKELAQ